MRGYIVKGIAEYIVREGFVNVGEVFGEGSGRGGGYETED